MNGLEYEYREFTKQRHYEGNAESINDGLVPLKVLASYSRNRISSKWDAATLNAIKYPPGLSLRDTLFTNNHVTFTPISEFVVKKNKNKSKYSTNLCQ